MRKFYLQNESGQRQSLNGEDGIHFVNPAGLGVNASPQFADVGYGFFHNKESKSEPQKSATGDFYFTKNSYSSYRDFVNWIMASEYLMLVYCPIGSVEYYRRIHISYLTKGELNSVGWLIIPANLLYVTPWYLPSPLRIDFTRPSAYAARYSFRYTPSLRYGNSSGGNMSASISPDGHVPAAIKVTYKGAAVNPIIKLVGASGKIYGQCKITATLGATDTLELSTAYLDSYVCKIAADGTITDLLGSVDIALEPFPRVPLTESCVLSISGDDALTGEAKAQVYYYFRTV